MWNIIKRYDLAGFKGHIKNYNNISKAGAISVSLLFLISLGAMLPIVPHTESAEAAKDPINPTPPTIAMVTGNDEAKLNLIPDNASGVFATSPDEDQAKFSVTTTNYTGYTLSVLSSDNTGELINPDNAATLDSIDIALQEPAFRDSGYYNGKWGFRPSKYVNSSNEVVDNTTTYFPSPDNSGTTLDITSGANPVANNYTIALGARADASFPIGVYSKTFTLVAVGNPATYNITFRDTSGDSSVANMPADLTPAAGSTASSVTIPSTIPTRTEYKFNKWCTAAPVDGACPSGATEYAPSDTFYLDPGTNNYVTLYATWELDPYTLTIDFAGEGVQNVKVCTVPGNCSGSNLIGTVTTSGGSVPNLIYNRSYYLYPSFSTLKTLSSWAKTAGQGTISSTTDLNPIINMTHGDGRITITGRKMTMQEFGGLGEKMPDTIRSMTTNEAYNLVDSRDNEIYGVAKLADGNVWLLDNLRLDPTNANVKSKLTSSTTNATDESLNYFKNGGGSFSGGYARQGAISVSSMSDWRARIIGDTPVSFTGQKDLVVSSYGRGSGKVGVYYNYCAATAGTACYSNGDYERAAFPQDICPAGWRMPIDLANYDVLNDYIDEELVALTNLYSTNNATSENSLQYNLSIPFAGYIGAYSDIVYNRDEYGAFWNSFYSDGTQFVSYSSILNMGLSSDGRIGLPMRCVLQHYDPLAENNIHTMQEFGSLSNSKKLEIMDSMDVGKNYSILDSRDGQYYGIAKLADGKIWLLDNLRLDLTNSNVKSKLNSTTTNATDESLGYLKNGGGDGDYARSGVSSNWNSYEQNTYESPLIVTNYKDTVLPRERTSGSNKVGVYYNYCAATAGSTCNYYAYYNAQDICPAGWHMPSKDNTTIERYKEYNQLKASYRSNENAALALSLPYSGSFTGNAVDDSASRLWSSDGTSSGSIPTFSSINGYDTLDRGYGAPVRCVLSAVVDGD